MKEELREMLERWKIKAEFFLKNDTRVFLVDMKDTYYWCDLVFVGEDTITVLPFEGIYKGIKKTLLWADVVKFEEYKEKEI